MRSDSNISMVEVRFGYPISDEQDVRRLLLMCGGQRGNVIRRDQEYIEGALLTEGDAEQIEAEFSAYQPERLDVRRHPSARV
jgi:hypothetical protein